MVEFLKKCWYYIKNVLFYTALVIYLIGVILPPILLYLDIGIIICWLYNLGLNLKDAITLWMTFCGGGGAAIGIYQMHRRVTIQEKQLQDTRFSSGAGLLKEKEESTRIGGIFSLYFLARDYDKEYLEHVCQVLCAHVRTITKKKKYQDKHKEEPAEEIQLIIDLLFKKDKDGNLIFNGCVKNLKKAFLSKVDFQNAILDNVFFGGATLTSFHFDSAKLTTVHFPFAKLDNVYFNKATLTDVRFDYAELTDVRFDYAELTDVRFDYATINNVSFANATLKRVAFSDTNATANASPSTTLTSVSFANATLNRVAFTFAKLTNISFASATLTDVLFEYLKLIENIDLTNAKLYESVSFTGTPLEGHSYEEITKEGSSLELTKKIIVENKPLI